MRGGGGGGVAPACAKTPNFLLTLSLVTKKGVVSSRVLRGSAHGLGRYKTVTDRYTPTRPYPEPPHQPHRPHRPHRPRAIPSVPERPRASPSRCASKTPCFCGFHRKNGSFCSISRFVRHGRCGSPERVPTVAQAEHLVIFSAPPGLLEHLARPPTTTAQHGNTTIASSHPQSLHSIVMR